MERGVAKTARRSASTASEDPHLLPVLPAGPVALRATIPAVEADYIVVEMAKHLLGENWMQDYVANANQGGIEKVLL